MEIFINSITAKIMDSFSQRLAERFIIWLDRSIAFPAFLRDSVYLRN